MVPAAELTRLGWRLPVSPAHVVAFAFPCADQCQPAGAASRSWRTSLILKRGKVLGDDVRAPSREVAEAAAVAAFQRRRLVVQERG
jgi:hypothetical protein